MFVYHRIAEPPHDPWNLAVSPARFAEQLQVMHGYGAVMPIGRMLRELAAGTLPSRAIAVTFDDGYADTLLAALPLLDRYDVPASMFLCPALLDGRTSFWWDSLTRIIFEPESLPARLEIELGDERVAWNAAGGAVCSRSAAGEEPCAEDRGAGATPGHARWPLYLKLWAALRRLPHEAQRQALAALSAWAGGPALDDPEERPLTQAEAARLAGDGLVEIGAHTLTHASLPATSRERQIKEIEGSKSACEEIAGARVESFSYPYGDHDAQSRALVREAGFLRAFTTAPWPLGRAADCLRLPRIAVLDWDGAQMERRLASLDFG